MSAAMAKRMPVVVVGGGINALGVLRSLATAGVPVTVLETDARQPAMRSRYGRKKLYQRDGPDAVIEALERLAKEMGAQTPLLILTQEDTVASVSMHRDRLQRLYRIVLPAHDVLTSLLHKDGFRATAEAAGAVIPRTLHITDDTQVDSLHTLRLPLVVKPAIRDADYASAFRKAYRVEAMAEAQALVHRILPTLPDVVVQEWIEGSDSDIYFCLQYITGAGDTAASFVGRKIRSWPPCVGGTASCAPALEAESAQLAGRTTDFFNHAGVCGFASMEYKRDVRSGEFFMVEPTIGRTDYQEEVATLNGVNMPLAAYKAELGLRPSRDKARSATYIWRDRAADIQSAARSDISAPWNPENARTINAMWRLSDPMPATIPFLQRVEGRALRMIRHGAITQNNKEPES